jgi:hypothetical protein
VIRCALTGSNSCGPPGTLVAFSTQRQWLIAALLLCGSWLNSYAAYLIKVYEVRSNVFEKREAHGICEQSSPERPA